jgi:hypothetical protein
VRTCARSAGLLLPPLLLVLLFPASSFSSLSCVIFICSRAAAPSSAYGELLMRALIASSISGADLPLAQMMKMKPCLAL